MVAVGTSVYSAACCVAGLGTVGRCVRFTTPKMTSASSPNASSAPRYGHHHIVTASAACRSRCILNQPAWTGGTQRGIQLCHRLLRPRVLRVNPQSLFQRLLAFSQVIQRRGQPHPGHFVIRITVYHLPQ